MLPLSQKLELNLTSMDAFFRWLLDAHTLRNRHRPFFSFIKAVDPSCANAGFNNFNGTAEVKVALLGLSR